MNLLDLTGYALWISLGPTLFTTRFGDPNPGPGGDPIALVGLAGAPLVLALVQLLKITLPATDPRYWPLATLAVAILFNLALAWLIGTPLGVAALLGLVTGLTASGMYSWASAGR